MQNLLLVLLHCCLNLLGLQHHLCLFRSNHTCRLSHGQESTPPIFLSRIASLSKEEAHGARPAGARPHPAGKTLGRHATRRVLRSMWLKPARPSHWLSPRPRRAGAQDTPARPPLQPEIATVSPHVEKPQPCLMSVAAAANVVFFRS